jgi:hypothetical protein
VEAGNLYDFDVKGQADGGGTLVDPYLLFFDAEGNFVGEGYEELFFEATESGTFFVAVQSWSVGTYTLDVTATPYVDDFGDDPDTEGRIAADESVNGTIGTPSDRDWLRIEMAPDSIYTFTLAGEAEGGGTLRDVELTLFDEAGNGLTAAGSELSFSTEAGGVHYISAGSWSGSVGTYTLEVTAAPYVDDFGSDPATAGAIMPGETVTGLIGAIGDEDWFAIDLEDDATYTIDLRGQSSGSGSLGDPLLRLLDSAGTELAVNDDWNGLDSQIVYTAGSDGTYYIAARELGSGTGDYQLSVSDPGAGAEAADLLLVA